VFNGSLGLFWTKACVGESLDSFLLYLFLYALTPYMIARNAFILCIYLSGAKTSSLLSKGVFLAMNQLIVGLSPSSETTYPTGHDIPL
jgi:hypothetical protein